MKKGLAVFALVLGLCSSLFAQEDEIKAVAKEYFDALAKRDMQKQEQLIYWKNYNWAGMGTLRRDYRKADDNEKSAIRQGHLETYNERFVDSRVKKLNRNLTVDDFKITSVEELMSGYAVNFDAPYAEGKSLIINFFDTEYKITGVMRAEPAE